MGPSEGPAGGAAGGTGGAGAGAEAAVAGVRLLAGLYRPTGLARLRELVGGGGAAAGGRLVYARSAPVATAADGRVSS